MADENTNTNGTPTNSADILTQLLNGNTGSRIRQEKLLESIDKNLYQLLKNSNKISISGASNSVLGNRNSVFGNSSFNQRYKNNNGFGFDSKNNFGKGSMAGFKKSMQDELIKGFLGADFEDKIHGVFDKLAANIGVSVSDIPSALGEAAGKKIVDAVKGSNLGGAGLDKLNKAKNNLFDRIGKKYNEGIDKWFSKNEINKPDSRPAPNPDIAASEALGSADTAENRNSVEKAVNKSTEPAADISDNLTFQANEVIIYAQKISTREAVSSPDISDVADTLDAAGSIPDIINLAGGAATAEAGAAGAGAAGARAAGAGAGAAGVAGAGVAEAGAAAGAAGVGAGAVGAGAVLGGLAAAAGPILLAIAGIALLSTVVDSCADALKETFAPAVEGASKLLKEAGKAANRYNESQKKNLEYANDRFEKDVRTMVTRPFEILEEAAQKWYDTWDNNLRVINASQGYNKEELQSLMGAFADRLRNENLTSVVSAADITDNLAKVLEAGLSGTVAEEFAYLATKLNAAVPTQDFFGYADTYASVAANAIRAGKSQNEAIAMANAQLESFASNVLYASREVAGGFTTGLKDAQKLFEQSVQIAQTAKIDNANEIAGVMTAVSAITGAIAPDLASSMTDAIYKAATGGNSSEIVALRSLAGINASNTEFLKQLATNPKEVFVNLFNELSKRQNMSPDAYMEVAEGLADIFGLTADAFARVDFAYLAQAISSMNTVNGSLADNMELLASGQTTTNDEMLKMQQINKYMLDEGLAYVIDNEAARFVQEHMWEEQQNRQLMEATYAVELQGAALEFLEGIRQTIDNILGFLNPFKILGKFANLGATIADTASLSGDIQGLLEAGKVGSGNAESKYQLITRNRDLGLTENIVDMLGGSSKYAVTYQARKLYNYAANPFTTLSRADMDRIHGAKSILSVTGFDSFTGDSSYAWNTIGKSIANQIASTPPSINAYTGFTSAANATQLSSASDESDTERAQKAANKKVEEALNSMSDFVKENKNMTYDDWKSFAVNKWFSNGSFDKALEGAGMTEESAKGQFDMLQTQEAAQEKLEREKREETFWENNTKLLTTTTEWLESINTHAENIFKKFEDYFTEWTKYFIDHAVYNSTFTHEDYDRVARADRENSETAIFALADALTQNDVKLLLDPTVQTNALLSQILKVVAAILTQTKDSGTALSLTDTIAGLSFGLISK